MTVQYDVGILGGGPGGYMTALRARQLGLTVILAEQERIGGVCLNRGCIPTKSLLADLDGFRWAKRAVQDGIIPVLPEIQFDRMVDRKDKIVNGMVSNLEKLLHAGGVEIVEGRASVPEPGVMTMDDGRRFTARSLVFATGSRQTGLPISGIDLPGIVGTREVLSIRRVPQRLVIVGGGIIGQEFAAIFAPLGSKVTILEALDRILSEVDAEMAKRFASLLPGQGITVETGARIEAFQQSGSSLRVVYEKKSKEKTVDADLVLIAAGRVPNTGGLGLDDLGIKTNKGSVLVDSTLRTSTEGIYAVGDVTGRKMLAHIAYYHGEIAAENIAGMDTAVEDHVVPSCVFTHPQIAWAGLTEEQAIASGLSFRSSMFSFSSNGKAQALGDSRGWVKLLEDSESGALVGAHILGPEASELIAELTLAVRMRLSAKDLADTIHAHPTLSEASRETALGLLEGSLHAASRVKTFGTREQVAEKRN
jgi:dihydrolipoamide dehydrogenase